MQDAPLAITADPAVRDEVDRIAAARGVALEHADATVSAGAWRRAPLILIDAGQVGAVAARMPRRDGVAVVAVGDLDATQWRSCLALGADRVLGLGAADDELVRLLADAVGGARDGGDGGRAGRLIAVIGACGGAGSTVFAAATALAARAADRAVLLADLDPWGAGLAVALGLESAGGARWDDIAAPSGHLPAEMLYRALPALPVGRERIPVLGPARGDDASPDPGLLDTVVDAVRRAGDVCVVDLPRAPLPPADRALLRADLTVLVTPADVRGCYGAARIADRLSEWGSRVGLVVRGPSPGGLGADDVASTLQLPLLAAMRPEPRLDRRMDRGAAPGSNPTGPLARAAAAVLDELQGPERRSDRGRVLRRRTKRADR